METVNDLQLACQRSLNARGYLVVVTRNPHCEVGDIVNVRVNSMDIGAKVKMVSRTTYEDFMVHYALAGFVEKPPDDVYGAYYWRAIAE